MTVWNLMQKLRTVSGAAQVCLQTGDGHIHEDFQVVVADDGTVSLQLAGVCEAGDQLLTQEE